jgi:hypothetical protein
MISLPLFNDILIRGVTEHKENELLHELCVWTSLFTVGRAPRCRLLAINLVSPF